MADKKTTELDPITTPVDADLTYIVVNVATTPLSKSLSWANLKATLKTFFDSLYEPLITYPTEAPENKFYRGDKTFHEIIIGSGGFAGNVYPSEADDAVIAGYKQLGYTPDASETEKTIIVNNNTVTGLTAIYPDAIGLELIPSGTWRAVFYAKVSSTIGDTVLKLQVFKRDISGTETDLFEMTSETIENTADYALFRFESSQLGFACASTDRLGCRIKGATTRTSNTTITYIIGNGRGAYFNTTIPTRHDTLRNLNGDNNFLHVTSTEKSTWDAKQDALGYTPEDVANKSTDVATDQGSDTKYPSVKAVYDWATGLFQLLSNLVTSFQATPDDTHYPSEKLVKDSLDAKQDTITKATGSDIDTGTDDEKYTTSKAIKDSGVISTAQASEFDSLTEKTSPADDDLILIEDSEASGAKKKVKKSSLGGGDAIKESFVVKSGESVTQGKVVMNLNNYILDSWKKKISDEENFAATVYLPIINKIDANNYVITYTTDSSSSYDNIQGVVATVGSDGSITFGSVYQLRSEGSYGFNKYNAIVIGTTLILAMELAGTTTGRIKVCPISGNVIDNSGGELTYYGKDGTGGSSWGLKAIDSSRFVTSDRYNRTDLSGTGFLTLFSFSGKVATQLDLESLDRLGTTLGDPKIILMDTDKIMIYINGQVKICTTTSSSITQYTGTECSNPTNDSCFIKMNTSLATIISSSSIDVLEVDGSNLITKTSTTLSSLGISNVSVRFALKVDSKIAIGFQSPSGGGACQVALITINETTKVATIGNILNLGNVGGSALFEALLGDEETIIAIIGSESLGSEVHLIGISNTEIYEAEKIEEYYSYGLGFFSSTHNAYEAYKAILLDNYTIAMIASNGSSAENYSRVLKVQSLAAKIIGISENTSSEGENASIILSGTEYNHSGLTPFADYYLQGDGSISNNRSSDYIGRSLSATSLNIKIKKALQIFEAISNNVSYALTVTSALINNGGLPSICLTQSGRYLISAKICVTNGSTALTSYFSVRRKNNTAKTLYSTTKYLLASESNCVEINFIYETENTDDIIEIYGYVSSITGSPTVPKTEIIAIPIE